MITNKDSNYAVHNGHLARSTILYIVYCFRRQPVSLVASCHKVHNLTVRSILHQKFYTQKSQAGHHSRDMGILFLASWFDIFCDLCKTGNLSETASHGVILC